jgi:hypothetical protein
LENVGLSKSFIHFARIITGHGESSSALWCEVGCHVVSTVAKYQKVPGMGEVCPACSKELDIYNTEEKSRIRTARVAPTAPIDPKKAGVIGWLQEIIFKDEKISWVKLKSLMEEKNYSPATINAQSARIKKAYVCTVEFIFLNEDCAKKLAEVR